MTQLKRQLHSFLIGGLISFCTMLFIYTHLCGWINYQGCQATRGGWPIGFYELRIRPDINRENVETGVFDKWYFYFYGPSTYEYYDKLLIGKYLVNTLFWYVVVLIVIRFKKIIHKHRRWIMSHRKQFLISATTIVGLVSFLFLISYLKFYMYKINDQSIFVKNCWSLNGKPYNIESTQIISGYDNNRVDPTEYSNDILGMIKVFKYARIYELKGNLNSWSCLLEANGNEFKTRAIPPEHF